MKRPEGFDAAAPPPARKPRSGVIDRPKRAPRAERAPAAVDPTPPRGARPPSIAAELRAAQRARVRAERAEIKRFTRAARRRRMGAWIAVGIAAAVGLIVTATVLSPALALRTIEVSGAERLDEAEIIEALDSELGLPLAFIDEARVAEQLAGFALIRSFVIELVPPDAMRVIIDEREPIGVVVSGAVFQLVDPAGIVIETSQTRPDDVPLIELPLGDDGTIRRAIAEVLLALPDKVLGQVDRITATTRDDVTFTLRSSDQRVLWGSAENPDRKALVLEALLAKWRSKGPGEYDVSGSGSATFRES